MKSAPPNVSGTPIITVPMNNRTVNTAIPPQSACLRCLNRPPRRSYVFALCISRSISRNDSFSCFRFGGLSGVTSLPWHREQFILRVFGFTNWPHTQHGFMSSPPSHYRGGPAAPPGSVGGVRSYATALQGQCNKKSTGRSRCPGSYVVSAVVAQRTKRNCILGDSCSMKQDTRRSQYLVYTIFTLLSMLQIQHLGHKQQHLRHKRRHLRNRHRRNLVPIGRTARR
jgi:hypothetical protein